MTDLELDIACADACLGAYHDPVSWERGNAHLVMAQHNDARIIAARGTDDPRDVLVDLDFIPKLHAGIGWCHEGFLADMLGIAEQVMHDLAGAPVWLTGHSKGGEIGILGGLMVLAGHPLLGIVTFNSPRLAFAFGDEVPRLVQVLEATPIRQYRHANEPVSFEPPAELGWHHLREPLIQLGTTTGDPLQAHRMLSTRAALVSSSASVIVPSPAAR